MAYITRTVLLPYTQILATPGWDAGARSIAELEGDGAFTFTVGQATGLVCGLNNNDASAHYSDIQHGFFIETTRYRIIESGDYQGDWQGYVSGDVFKVERLAGTVYYYCNDVVVGISTTPSSGTVFLDSSLWAFYDQICDISVTDYTTATGVTTVGDELLTNPSFATDLADWTATGWTWSAGSADSNSSNTNPLSQVVAIEADQAYQVRVTVDGSSTGTLTITLDGVEYTVEIDNTTGTVVLTNENGGAATVGYVTNPDGSITIIIDFVGSITDDVTFSLTPSSDFDGVVDEVSLKEILVDPITVSTENLLTNGDLTTDLSGWGSSGWTFDAGSAQNNTNNSNPLTQTVALQDEQSYQLQVTVSDSTQGSITITLDGVDYTVTIDNTAGTVTYVKEDGSSGSLSFTTNPDGSITIIIDFTAPATDDFVLSITPTSDFDGAIDSVFLATTSGAQSGVAFIEVDLAPLQALGIEGSADNFLIGLLSPLSVSAMMTDVNFGEVYLAPLTGRLVDGDSSLNVIDAALSPLTAWGEEVAALVPDFNIIAAELRPLEVYGLRYDPDPASVDASFSALDAFGADFEVNLIDGVFSPLQTSAILGLSSALYATWPTPQFTIRQVSGENGNAYGYLVFPDLALTATGNENDNASVELTLPVPTLSTQLGAIAALPLPALNLSITTTSEGFATADLTIPALTLSSTGYVGEVATSAMTLPALTLTATMGAYASLEMVAPILAASATSIGLAQASLTFPPLELAATGESYGFATVALEIPALTLLSGPSRVELELPLLILTAQATQGPDVAATTYAVNLNTGAVTQLLLGEFDKLVIAQGRLYGLQGTTLVRLEGDVDGTDTEIPATIRFAPQTFGTNQVKRLSDVYLNTREYEGVTLSVVADETTAWRYQTATDKAQAYGTHKVKVGRGIAFHTAGLILQNRGGGKLDVGGMELLVSPLSRKI